jgi:hypothetical protein
MADCGGPPIEASKQPRNAVLMSLTAFRGVSSKGFPNAPAFSQLLGRANKADNLAEIERREVDCRQTRARWPAARNAAVHLFNVDGRDGVP